jgi:XTP/dITP diphosphohydrolase
MDNSTQSNTLEALGKLIEVIAKLRDPIAGCPWDLEQTPESLTPYILEESYETVAAIKSGEAGAMVEELGDLLLQIVLQAQIASEKGVFTLEDIAKAITEKMIRRHPHVFAELQVENIEQIGQNWEKIKAQETGLRPSQQLAKYLNTLPPLISASKISRKAASWGFEWENVQGVWEKFEEELAEFKDSLESQDKVHQESELGDLLFTCINIARWYNLDPSAGLTGTSERFIKRLAQIESQIDKPLEEYTLEQLEALWHSAKAKLKQEEAK